MLGAKIGIALLAARDAVEHLVAQLGAFVFGDLDQILGTLGLSPIVPKLVR